MKGDLHTLKKVCLYASKAMLIGEAVLGLIIILTLSMGVGALVSDTLAGHLSDWVEFLGAGSSDGFAVAEVLLILALGLITVNFVRKLMNSIHDEYSPFTAENVESLKHVSVIYLVSSVLLAALELLTNGNISGAVFMFLGSMLISVVMYCLALVFRYGGVLQKESDETL